MIHVSHHMNPLRTLQVQHYKPLRTYRKGVTLKTISKKSRHGIYTYVVCTLPSIHKNDDGLEPCGGLIMTMTMLRYYVRITTGLYLENRPKEID